MPAPPPARPDAEARDVRPLWQWTWPLLGAVGLFLVVAAVTIDRTGLLEVGPRPWRVLVTLPGHALLLYAWWRMGPTWRRPRLVLALWSLILLVSPPLHSRDAYSYAAQGWLMSHGLDPYTVASGDAGQAGLLVGIHWFRTTSVYPPLSLEIFGVISRLFEQNLYLSAIGMRLPNLLAIAVLAWCLPKLADLAGVRRDVVVWAGLLNPVLLVQWVGGIHNDAVMVALLAVAFLAAHRTGLRGWRGVVVGGLFIGLAMSIKQSAAVAGVGVVALAWAAAHPTLSARSRTWWGLAARAAAGGAAAVGMFALVSFVTGLGLGWRNPTAGSPLQATSNAPISWVASFARFHELLPNHQIISILTTFTSLLVVAGVAWLAWRLGPRPPSSVGQPWLLACGVLLAFAVLGPALQPWYMTWVLPFVALARPGLRLQHLFLLVTVLCVLLAPLQDVMAPYMSMGVLALPAWLLWRRLRRDDVAVLQRDETLV
ncbi:polyprenol phosphomannose-dependent alpha 1,6 mannosyltransferase MptB [Tessaracoccus antarcticus]|uniref:polyprenol phosphomannose-dependent alpha 1,6 mannosyltransferase MptB n=1 Tax=Tessaracoccus antarcticus TaxID=2479848 RepID=UPI0013146DCE|nr:polyprenol phosphomannose-dependent alpha 1,6 mannosyltransferase MptB [Tessaracoccus antarcticus]